MSQEGQNLEEETPRDSWSGVLEACELQANSWTASMG